MTFCEYCGGAIFGFAGVSGWAGPICSCSPSAYGALQRPSQPPTDHKYPWPETQPILTARQYAWLHAPEVPEWFTVNWRNVPPDTKGSTIEERRAEYRYWAWRDYFADRMVG